LNPRNRKILEIYDFYYTKKGIAKWQHLVVHDNFIKFYHQVMTKHLLVNNMIDKEKLTLKEARVRFLSIKSDTLDAVKGLFDQLPAHDFTIDTILFSKYVILEYIKLHTISNLD